MTFILPTRQSSYSAARCVVQENNLKQNETSQFFDTLDPVHYIPGTYSSELRM